MNQPQTIIHKKAGFEVPKELLETAIRKCPTVSGFAIRETAEDKVTLECDHSKETVQLESMLRVNSETKDLEAVLYFGNIPGKFTGDDIQPFVLAICNEEDETKTPILAVFVEGDFPKYTSKDHTDEYNFYHDIIEPTLEDMFLSADQDMGKFIASLHKPLFEKNLLAHVGHRAAFVFVPLEGDPIKFGTNELGLGADWGTCSQHLDFAKKVEKPIIAAAAETVKKFNPFGKKLPEGVHQVPPAVEKTATAITAGKTLVKPPTGLDKSARNRWLRLMNNGNLPDKHDHRDFQGVWVTPDVLPFAQRSNITTVAQVDALGAEMRNGIKPKPMDMKADKPRSPSDYLPVLDDAEMTSLTGTLSKFIDRDKVPSALEIQRVEANWPTFSEKAGIKFEDTFRWTMAEALELEKKALLLLWLETRRQLIQKWDPAGFAATVKVGSETVKHEAAKQILKPEGTAASKRAALFGKKSA